MYGNNTKKHTARNRGSKSKSTSIPSTSFGVASDTARSVRRMVHQEMFHPYKICVVQELLRLDIKVCTFLPHSICVYIAYILTEELARSSDLNMFVQ